jgi:hypothetical protein
VTDMRTGAPRSIREFLDAGGDLATLDRSSFLAWLAELLVGDRLRMGGRREALAASRGDSETPAHVNRAEILAQAERHGVREAMEQDFARSDLFRSWVQEMLDDEALADRVEAALPPALVREELEGVEAETAPLRIVVENRGALRVCGQWAGGRRARHRVAGQSGVGAQRRHGRVQGPRDRALAGDPRGGSERSGGGPVSPADDLPDLREFLDAGGDVTTVPGLNVECLLDTAVDQLTGASEMLDLSGLRDMARDERVARSHGHALGLWWSADLTEDADLAAYLVDKLPPHLQAEVATRVEEYRHSSPLLVEEAEANQRCGACGERPVGLVVVPREGDHVYCRACITLAAEAVNGGQP